MKLVAQSDFFIKHCGGIESLDRVKKIGYEYISYTVSDRYDEPFTTQWGDKELEEYFAPIGNAIKERGLKLFYVEVGGDIYNDLLTHTTEARTKMCLQVVKACHYLGCDTVAIKPAKVNRATADAWEITKNMTYQILDQVKAEADKYGIKLAITNNIRCGGQYLYGSEPDELLELCERYDAKAIINPSSAFVAHERVGRFISKVGDKLFAFLINDLESSNKNPFMPMMGSLDYATIIEALKGADQNAGAVMMCTPVFNRFKQFVDHQGVNDSLDTLLYKMGLVISGNL